MHSSIPTFLFQQLFGDFPNFMKLPSSPVSPLWHVAGYRWLLIWERAHHLPMLCSRQLNVSRRESKAYSPFRLRLLRAMAIWPKYQNPLLSLAPSMRVFLTSWPRHYSRNCSELNIVVPMLCDDYQGIFGTKTDTQGTAVIDWVIGVVSCVSLSCHDVAVVNFLK